MAQTQQDRLAAALRLVARRSQWLVGTSGGRVVCALVPSQSEAQKYHRVSLDLTCDCLGYGYRGACAHSRALELALASKRMSRKTAQ